MPTLLIQVPKVIIDFTLLQKPSHCDVIHDLITAEYWFNSGLLTPYRVDNNFSIGYYYSPTQR